MSYERDRPSFELRDGLNTNGAESARINAYIDAVRSSSDRTADTLSRSYNGSVVGGRSTPATAGPKKAAGPKKEYTFAERIIARGCEALGIPLELTVAQRIGLGLGVLGVGLLALSKIGDVPNASSKVSTSSETPRE